MNGNLPGQTVSATAFVRNFASYARSALGEPIHILNHGHPGLSLIATDLFQRFANAGAGLNGDCAQAKLDFILESVPTLVIVTDDQFNVRRMNAAALRHFQRSKAGVIGAPIVQVMPHARQHVIIRALERVRDTGVAEAFDVDSVERSGTLRITVTRFPEGFALFADDVTHLQAMRERDACAVAYESLIDDLPGLARGAINARGVVSAASPALADLVQSDVGRIVGIRFPALFDAVSRSGIADCVDALFAGGRPFMLRAALLGQGARTTPVQLSAALLDAPGRADRALFLIRDVPD